MERKPGAEKAEAKETIRLYENIKQVLTDDVEVSTAKEFYLYDDIYRKEKLLVGVYTLDNSEEAVQHNGTDPLATLNDENSEKTFKLISEDVTDLQYSSYEGTMEFTITYGESN